MLLEDRLQRLPKRRLLDSGAAGTVTVDSTPGSLLAGTTRFAQSMSGPHRIATAVNSAVFFREFFGVF